MWRAIRSRRTRLTLVWAPFVVVALAAAAFLVADQLGRREAERILSRLEQEGFPVSVEAHFDLGLSEDENVLAHPGLGLELGATQLARLEQHSFGLPAAERRPRRPRPDPKAPARQPGITARPPKAEPPLGKVTPVGEWFDPPLPGGETEAAERLLEALEPKIELAHRLGEAYRRRGIQWQGADLRSDAEGQRPFVSKVITLRNSVLFHRDAAVLLLAAGRGDEAARLVETNLRIARHLREGRPSTVSYLVSVVVHRVAYDTIWEGCARQAWEDRHLQRFAELFAGDDPDRCARAAAISEAVLLAGQLRGSRGGRMGGMSRSGWRAGSWNGRRPPRGCGGSSGS